MGILEQIKLTPMTIGNGEAVKQDKRAKELEEELILPAVWDLSKVPLTPMWPLLEVHEGSEQTPICLDLCKTVTQICVLLFDIILIIMYPFIVIYHEAVNFVTNLTYYFLIFPFNFVLNYYFYPLFDVVHRFYVPTMSFIVWVLRPILAIFAEVATAFGHAIHPCVVGVSRIIKGKY